MSEYKKVCRCKECGKIYPNGISYICGKCGATIGKQTSLFLQAMGGDPVTLTDKCEKVIAKKGLFGWKIRQEVVDESGNEISGE